MQSLYNGNSYMGVIGASLSPNPSFVVGANITAQVKIGLLEASNDIYIIEIMFPDAIVVRDIPPYTWQQDWTYLLHDTQFNETEQIQTLSNVTLVYAQEGIYDLNMTITQASTNTKLNFHFDNLVQVKPLSYLDEQFRSNVTFALSYGILGLTFIMVAPVIVQLIDFVEKILEKPQSQKSCIDTTIEDKPQDSKMSDKQAKDEILELIRLVDRSKSKLFRPLDIYRGDAFFSFISILILLFFIEIFLMFGDASATDKIVVALSFLAIAAAMFSLLGEAGEENIVRTNFNRLEKCVEDNNKPLLKALIKTKAKNREFGLEQIYNMNPSMFTREKLLERLYE
ncbi:hypothetical protein MUO83_02390 [Candidatus Bathyarchaeota archaeon]|nr:hypothetical protein [Candidatus Bathyarchaeota archaeon]